MKKISTKSISLKDTPEIMRLAEGDEDISDLTKLGAEVILIRWINFHLKAAGQELRVTNLGKDLKDGKVLTYVLNQLDSQCSLEGLALDDEIARLEKVVDNSAVIGVPDLATAQDLHKGNSKVNLLFVSELFNTKHGLDELTKEEYEAAAMVDDDVEGSREERSCRLWVNSLDIEGLFIEKSLIEDCRTGVVLLQIIDKIDNTIVNWK